MSNKETGGPAFPVHPDMVAQLNCIPSQSDAGMSLRDYFAAKAMQELMGVLNKTDGTRTAYEWADAMLKAREA